MTTPNPSEAEVATTLGRALETLPGVAQVDVSLTAAGSRIAGRLGGVWFARVLAALGLAYPDRDMEVVLAVEDSEPMGPARPIFPTLSGPMYSEGRAVGRISVRAATPRGEPIRRTVVLPGERALDGDPDFHFITPTDLKRRVAERVYAELYGRAPLILDEWRQRRNTRVQSRRGLMRPDAEPLHSVGSGVATDAAERPTAWFALHWLEPGGAESWALESAQLAAQAGFRVVMTVDMPAPQRLLERALAITPDVFLAANGLAEEDWDPFVVGLLVRYAPTLVHVHHSRRAYSALPDVRHLLRGTVVVDSTHIIEHRTGGFVRQSIELSSFIDLHHVISPELRDVYQLDAGLSEDRVAYHPLTAPGAVVATQRPDRQGPLRVGFLGRLAPQKRPFLFVELARRLHRKDPEGFTFVMQGDGVLGSIVDAQVSRSGLGGSLRRVAWGPVDGFMESVDVLVISSDNEGLTLTTLEAEEHGVLVLSADVGSQRSVVAPALLAPREPHAFLRAAEAMLRKLAESPDADAAARAAQSARVRLVSSVQPASSYFADFYASLEEKH